MVSKKSFADLSAKLFFELYSFLSGAQRTRSAHCLRLGNFPTSAELDLEWMDTHRQSSPHARCPCCSILPTFHTSGVRGLNVCRVWLWAACWHINCCINPTVTTAISQGLKTVIGTLSTFIGLTVLGFLSSELGSQGNRSTYKSSAL